MGIPFNPRDGWGETLGTLFNEQEAYDTVYSMKHQDGEMANFMFEIEICDAWADGDLGMSLPMEGQ